MKPYRVCLFVVVCLLVLWGGSWLLSEQQIQVGTYQWQIPDVRGGHTAVIDTVSSQDTVLLLSMPPLLLSDLQKELVGTLVKEPQYQPLFSFYESLSSAADTSVRVVHYGDSQIEGDRMTMCLRRALQDKYGGSGVGMVALYQNYDSRTVKLSLSADISPSALPVYRAYGSAANRRPNGIYGPMGQVFVLNNKQKYGSEKVSIRYSATQDNAFSRIRVFGSTDSLVILDERTTTYSLHLKGEREVYGVSLESEKGVYVDNIPMRGCSGTIFTSIDNTALSNYFRTTNTRLIIMQFGGNVVPYIKTQKQVDNYINKIRKQIRYLHICAPQAAILFVGPSDMLYQENGEKRSYPIISLLDEELRKAVEEEKSAYWSLYNAMGGENSMCEWQQKGWTGSDGIHFTRQGSDQAGQMLTEFLLQPLKKAE